MIVLARWHGRLLLFGSATDSRRQGDPGATMRQRAIPVAVSRTRDDAVAELDAYRKTYPRRAFEIEVRDDGRDAPWRVVLQIGRPRLWQRLPLVRRGPFSRFLADTYLQAVDPLRACREAPPAQRQPRAVEPAIGPTQAGRAGRPASTSVR